ncbi:Protein spitz [Araneus ventricosus]|uniref:Protein spitz n=1 Tax=Araneus ventricosus TaxID=182803 RepID=A0A4Y2DNS7_ARAVE|nr:Protein spitz [Araneus ventricosus]
MSATCCPGPEARRASKTTYRLKDSKESENDYVILSGGRRQILKRIASWRRWGCATGGSLWGCRSRPGRPQIRSYYATMVPRLLFILYITSCFTITACCSSRSTPKPRPTIATARPNVTFETYACPEAYAKWYCLNGATCFAIKIRDSILYNCECADGYMGQRCEFKDLDGSYLPSREREIQRAGIAGGLLIVILIIALFYLIYYLTTRLRRRYVAYYPDPELGRIQQQLVQPQPHLMTPEAEAKSKTYSNGWLDSVFRWRQFFGKEVQSLTSPQKCQVAIVSQSPYLEHCNSQEHYCPPRQGHCVCPHQQELRHPHRREHSYSHRLEQSHRH